jgi:hypothetical protein
VSERSRDRRYVVIAVHTHVSTHTLVSPYVYVTSQRWDCHSQTLGVAMQSTAHGPMTCQTIGSSTSLHVHTLLCLLSHKSIKRLLIVTQYSRTLAQPTGVLLHSCLLIVSFAYHILFCLRTNSSIRCSSMSYPRSMLRSALYGSALSRIVVCAKKKESLPPKHRFQMRRWMNVLMIDRKQTSPMDAHALDPFVAIKSSGFMVRVRVWKGISRGQSQFR